MCGFISEDFILFYWSVCLYCHQYYAVLIAVDLQQVLKSGGERPPTSFFFLKIVGLF